MSVGEILQLAGLSPFLAYLIWRETADRKERRQLADAKAEIDKADIASREKLASSLTALSLAITGRPSV